MKFLLIAGHGEPDGPIATKTQYENGEDSFAHLYANGEIRQNGNVIGTRADLRFTGREIECKPSAHAFMRLMGWDTGTREESDDA